MAVLTWTETTSGPKCNGDSAGQAQMSTAWGRRFSAPMRDGYHLVLDVEAVVVDAHDPEPGGPPHLVVTVTVAHTVCTTPADPLRTEVRSAHTSIDLRGTATNERAYAVCAAFTPAASVPSDSEPGVHLINMMEGNTDHR